MMQAQNKQKYITEYENIFQLKIFETLNKLWLFAVGILLWPESPHLGREHSCWLRLVLEHQHSGPRQKCGEWGPRGKSLMAKRCLKSSWNHIKSSPTWGGEEKQKLLINKYFCLCVGFFPSDEILYFNTFWQEILLINNQEKDHLSVVHLKIELWVKGLGYLSCYLSICLV